MCAFPAHERTSGSLAELLLLLACCSLWSACSMRLSNVLENGNGSPCSLTVLYQVCGLMKC